MILLSVISGSGLVVFRIFHEQACSWLNPSQELGRISQRPRLPLPAPCASGEDVFAGLGWANLADSEARVPCSPGQRAGAEVGHCVPGGSARGARCSDGLAGSAVVLGPRGPYPLSPRLLQADGPRTVV